MAKDKKIEYIKEEERESFEGQYKKLKKLLQQCKGEKAEYLDGWQRARAELQNYIKQKDIEMEEFRKFAISETVLKILPILDTLALAASSTSHGHAGGAWARGILNIVRQFEVTIRQMGVEEIKAERGISFDPVYHEATDKVESNLASGTVEKVLQKGYTLNGKVLRPARVKVAK